MQKSHNILIIDDDKLMCVSLKGLLEENGYHVYTASNGDNAVQILNKHDVDLILFDLRLHDVREFSLLNKIKQVSADTIILVMIDQYKIKAVINTLCLDTVDYILKPFDPDYLKKTIEKALYKQQLEVSLKRTVIEKEIISNTNKIIAASLDIRESFSSVCNELKKIIPFDRSCLITSNEQGQWFQVFALTKTYNFSEINEGESFPMSGSLLEEIVKTGEPVIVNNTEAGRFWTDRVLFKERIHSRLGFPLTYKGKVLGALTFGSEKANSFSEQCYYYLWQIAPQLAIAIENTKLFNRIKASEERYKTLFNHAADSMLMIDLNGKILTVNQREEEIIGYRMEELLGKYIYDFLPETSKKAVTQLLSMAVNSKVPTTEIEVISKNQQTLVMELDITVVKEGDNVLHLLVHFRDITRRKNLESELKEEKKKLDNIVSEIGADLLVINKNNTICWANKRLIENHPLGKKIINQTCFDSYCHLQSVPSDCPSAKVFDTGRINQIERTVHNHHKKRFYNVISSPIFDKDGNVVQVLELIQDITGKKQEEEKQKRLQQQLVHSDRLISIGRLAAGVAHEINTPLAILSGMIQGFLERNNSFTKEIVKEFKTMHKVTKRIEKTVDSLLELSHLEGNEQPKPININELIKDTISLIVEQFTAKNKNIILKLSSRLPKIKGFAEQLQQVFMNLLINADDATVNGDTISITTTQKDKNTINVNFKDTGTGMHEDVLSKVFDPFFTTKEVGKGTGLGLSITYGIVKRHHGTIHVKSKVGRGTTFDINLPIDFGKVAVHG
ncbi:MAG: PAS domain S-box protein [Candidatus Brocadia sp. AMX2]|uniref:histidine kinase n=1 Tax=Candidatus Brocadia sinica JPN1 TaxID=1197129 RepID=A0ABQ0JX60_9BACT|nr:MULTISPECIES: PAS domain S-box protein [Brocadia]KXK30356.1 MAG: two-component sensor kinase [Candidatus Brocadia sinica]MBC6931062.1 PAS domain S-box protein [Candidatus Brocadia sp.]MBL1168161.1 PAS domain S-box protein [Candidatus Brocadia sp. AMX1]NOG40934.1 PAS domain S-box protein [Planctomycetota bacterium]KAA0244273.1 MAG: PAS domain S-box protein [Candidatus Brocadia sp. AMX2]